MWIHKRETKGLTTVVSSFYLISGLDWRYVGDQEGRTGDFTCEYETMAGILSTCCQILKAFTTFFKKKEINLFYFWLCWTFVVAPVFLQLW